jgi:hypothetical protein
MSMSQASNVNSTSNAVPQALSRDSSRRGFLTIAAGGAVAAAIPAAAQAAVATADPIYAVIERHRAEQKVYVDAIMARDKLHEIVPEEIRRGPRVQFGMKDGEPYYLRTHKQIDDRLEWMPDFGATPEIRARLHDELYRDRMELSAKWAETGMPAAEARVEKLCDSFHDLSWAVATTVPTSLAGIAAVLQYVNEWEDAGEEWPDTDTIGSDGWHYQLRQTIAAALEAFQGRGQG